MENKNRKQGRKKKSWENERKEIKREGGKKGWGKEGRPTFKDTKFDGHHVKCFTHSDCPL